MDELVADVLEQTRLKESGPSMSGSIPSSLSDFFILEFGRPELMGRFRDEGYAHKVACLGLFHLMHTVRSPTPQVRLCRLFAVHFAGRAARRAGPGDEVERRGF